MLALYCLYSGGVSGWGGFEETLYWRVETTVTGKERGTERGEGGEEMQTKEGNKQRKTEKRKT